MNRILFVLLIILTSLELHSQKKDITNVLIPFKVKNKWGFSDYNRSIKVKPLYDSVKPLDEYVEYPLATVFVDNKTKLPKENVNIKENYIERFRIFKDGLYGIINSKNETIIPINYDRISVIEKNVNHNNTINYRYSVKKKIKIIY